MNRRLDITIQEGDLSGEPEKPVVDPVTGYPVQLWEQLTLEPSRRVFIVLYYRQGHWRKGSTQLLDRTLRRHGLPGLHDCPWGPGPEMLASVDDMIVSRGGPPATSGALRDRVERGE